MLTDDQIPDVTNDPIDLSVTPHEPSAELTPEQRRHIHDATKQTYHAARAFGRSVEESRHLAEVVAQSFAESASLPTETPTRATHAESEADGPDPIGLARSERDLAAAIAAGFAPAPTVYARGLRVIDAGVEAARASRVEYERKPLVSSACASLVATVKAEERSDRVVRAQDVMMRADGWLGRITAPADEPVMWLESDAFAQLCSRLGYGGARYLGEHCPPSLRAHNVNAQRERLQNREGRAFAEWAMAPTPDPKREPKSLEVSLRTRKGHDVVGDEYRSIFAVTSPGYAAFDADMVAEAVAAGTPPDARGSVFYDGRRSRFEVLFQTTVQPKHFVAGEFFRAGVIVRSDDTGGGAVRGQSVVWQNLCLNLAIIDKQARDLFSLIHMGSVEELARKLRREFKRAIDSLSHFLVAWDYACEDRLIADAERVSDGAIPTTDPEAFMRGIFAGLLGGGARAKVKLGGRALERQLDELVSCWKADESSARAVHATSRAAVVNAFTRYAHECLAEVDDPFAEDEITAQACALLWANGQAKAPKALEWVDPESVIKRSAEAAP